MSVMPAIDSCAATDCSFNEGGCNAFAVTMGQSSCATFISLDERGGLPKATPQVGACQRADCTHNHNLVCEASGVKISADETCLTYHPAA